MAIQYPDPAQVRAVVGDIIDTVGSNVLITYVSDSILCPTCGGNDPFCPTCEGNVYVRSELTYTQKGTVKWKSLEKKIYRPEGQYMEGDCTVTFLNVPQLEAILPKIISVLVDGRKCVIDKWNLQGISNSRIYLVLKEDTNSGRTG